MAWIRLSDDYTDHPKFAKLSDGAFRLWHQAMGFCRKFQTDGEIPLTNVRSFTAYTAKRMGELVTPWRVDAQPLWHVIEGIGIRVHDYLEWNPSKDEVTEQRQDAKERMRAKRLGLKTLTGSEYVRANNTPNILRSSHNVPGLGRDLDPDRKKIEALECRAGRLLERYAAMFVTHRRGAKYHNRMHLDFPKAVELVTTWDDDAHLDKLAQIVLTTDDDWISRTDRGFGVFAARATWADDRLREAQAS